MHVHRLATGFMVASALALSVVTYSMAQGRPGMGPHKHGMMEDAGAGHRHASMHGAEKCPLQQLLSLAELKVERTKGGAAVQLSAKDPAKVAEVQSLADEFAAHLKSDGCPFMKEKPATPPGKPTGR